MVPHVPLVAGAAQWLLQQGDGRLQFFRVDGRAARLGGVPMLFCGTMRLRASCSALLFLCSLSLFSELTEPPRCGTQVR